MTISHKTITLSNDQLKRLCREADLPAEPTRLQLLLHASRTLASKPIFASELESLLWQFGLLEQMRAKLGMHGFLHAERTEMPAEFISECARQKLLLTLAEAVAIFEQEPGQLQGKLVIVTKKEAGKQAHLKLLEANRKWQTGNSSNDA